MIKQVKFISIPTGDQERALKFWTEQVGFKLMTDQPMGEGPDAQRWIEMAVPGAQTRVVLFTPEGHEERIGGFFNGSFGCENVEYTYDKLKAKGVEFAAPPTKQPWGTFATFRDPDGNTFVLSSL